MSARERELTCWLLAVSLVAGIIVTTLAVKLTQARHEIRLLVGDGPQVMAYLSDRAHNASEAYDDGE